jgi:uncharacterized protein (TIGR03905 family)
MKHTYYPKGVCSSRIDVSLENGVIEDVQIEDGCHGNSQGIAALVKGRKVEDVIEALKGMRCGRKNTSCPDQLAAALKRALEEENLILK